ncbi:MAG TPA: hypothetical protein DHU55_00820, partial [Blastocatellia bacterium]|nr:hypothetical protein [Blastocatellia bacterium]
KGFLIRSRKRKKRQKSKAIPALWYNVQKDERGDFFTSYFGLLLYANLRGRGSQELVRSLGCGAGFI